jgi:hypothetical protein
MMNLALRQSASILAVFLLLALLPTEAIVNPGDIGFEDQDFTGTTAPTGSKPESKLWWNDGFWWGSLFDTLSGQYHIFKLDLATQTWVDTGVPLDDRSGSRADVLWDGTHLYVASHIHSASPAAGFPSRLYRFSYDDSTRTYSRDLGFPVHINDYRTETLVLDKDSTGKLWATWIQDQQVYVNCSVGNDLLWGTPFVLPVSGTSVASDDTSSVVSFGNNKVGILWSNQTDSAMYFAVHLDGQPDDVWEPSRTAVQGPGSADDHINLESLQSDGTGRVFAAVETSFTSSSEPQILLLVRDQGSGDWTSHVFGTGNDNHTRPIVLLDELQGMIHMFATGPDGAIYEKITPIDSIAFGSGIGTPVILDASDPGINDATSTKQNLDNTTGLLVLASNSDTGRYWHAYDPLCAPRPEVCDGVDNDCDGFVDNRFDVGAPCILSGGGCVPLGLKICTSDGSGTICEATRVDATCDGVDDDCDGQVDG